MAVSFSLPCICPNIRPGHPSLLPPAPLTLCEISATKDLQTTIGWVGGHLGQHSRSVNVRYWVCLFLEVPQPHMSHVPCLSLSLLGPTDILLGFQSACPVSLVLAILFLPGAPTEAQSASNFTCRTISFFSSALVWSRVRTEGYLPTVKIQFKIYKYTYTYISKYLNLYSPQDLPMLILS